MATLADTTTRLYSRKFDGLYCIFINRKDFLYRRTDIFKAINKKIPCHIKTDLRNWVSLAYESIWPTISTLSSDNVVYIRIISLRVTGNIQLEGSEVRNND